MRLNTKPGWRTIQGRPVWSDIAPYIAILVNDTGQRVTSINRSRAAEPILNAHGLHSQAQLYDLSVHGTPQQRRDAGLDPNGGGVNPPGLSTHEKFSDGVA